MNPSILIIDDEKLIRERLAKLLRLDDFDVFLAENGAEGVETFEKERPDLVLTDIKMPGIDGIEVLKRIKAKDEENQTEVLVFTGHAVINTAVEALKLGAFDYLLKPVNYDELLISLKRAIERQSIQKSLEKTRIQLKQSSQLASLGVLASGVGHELNNPLHAIMGITSLIKKQNDKPEVIIKLTEKLEKASDRMKGIITQLRTFAESRSQDSWKELDVNKSIMDSFIFLETQLTSRGIHVETHLAEGLPLMVADKIKIESIFQNLITNARDCFENQEPEKKKVITITSFLTDEGHIGIKFTDSGSGIPQDIQESVFEPFFTTKEVGKGPGLGLAIITDNVSSHQGTIALDSTEGEGTTFHLTFPIRALGQES